METSRSSSRMITALSIVLRVVLCAVFAYAGIVKLIGPATFFADVQSYRFLSRELAIAVTYFIPALEVVCAMALWLPRYRVSASAILTLLLAAFTILLAISWVRGLDITCGCFGNSDGNRTPYPLLLVRDLALLALAAVVFAFERHRTRRISLP